MSNYNHITVGVLIPTYQRRAYLEEALKSVFVQTYDHIEIIVIDNGSTDGTADLMATISNSRVRYIRNDTNIGMIGSINKGVALFSSDVEWCTILSDDDLLEKNFIELLLNAVTSRNVKTIVHSHRIFIDEHGAVMRHAIASPSEESALEYIDSRAHFERETYLTGVLFSRKAFNEIHGYPVFITGLASDDAFIFTLALRDRLVFEPKAIVFVRIHKGAESVIYSDGILKIHTILQFGKHCTNLVNEANCFNKKQNDLFRKTLHLYMRMLNSSFWIKSAHYLLSSQNFKYEQLTEHLSIVRDNRDAFSYRVKFAVACDTIGGFFPEAYSLYRSIWDHLTYIAKQFRQHVHR